MSLGTRIWAYRQSQAKQRERMPELYIKARREAQQSNPNTCTKVCNGSKLSFTNRPRASSDVASTTLTRCCQTGSGTQSSSTGASAQCCSASTNRTSRMAPQYRHLSTGPHRGTVLDHNRGEAHQSTAQHTVRIACDPGSNPNMALRAPQSCTSWWCTA